MDIAAAAIYFSSIFILTIVLFSLIVLVCRKCRMFTAFLFYCFLASVLFFVAFNNFCNVFSFYDGLPEVINGFLAAFTVPFIYLYDIFTAFILSIASLITDDLTALSEFLGNLYFMMGLHGGLFLLCAIIFRKRKKRKIETSRYSD